MSLFATAGRHSQTPRPRARTLRLMYVAGPGDVANTYRYWREGRDDPSQVSLTYSGQLFDVSRELDAETLVVAFHPCRAKVRDGRFRILHRAPPFARSRSAALYHLGQLWSAASIIVRALGFRADVVVHSGGTSLWFMMRLLPPLRIAVVPVLTCVLWRKNEAAPGRAQRLIRRLDRAFWSRSAVATLSMSADISTQVAVAAGGDPAPILEFLPTYRADTFSSDPPPPRVKTPFRVLFAGRIERNKGVFELLEIASRLDAAHRSEIEFDLCGTGSAFQELAARVESSGLSGRFRLHGHCERGVMRQMFRDCHVVIAPTTTDFIEGFNQVVVEGVLAGRPVITSSVCPAIEYVRAAVVEVPPDDIDAYQNAVLELFSNAALYAGKRAACVSLQRQFYDPAHGFAATLRKALEPVINRCAAVEGNHTCAGTAYRSDT